MAAPTKTAVEAERERLRAKGYNEEDIRQILIQQEVHRASPQPGAGPPVQTPMTGVLGNASAVISHVRGTIPAIKADAANLANSGASRASRTKSAAVLVGVAVVVAVLAYALYQEWQIHIVNGPIKAEADASQSAAQARAMNSNIDDMVAEMRKTEKPEARALRLHKACLKTEYDVQFESAQNSGHLEKFSPTKVEAACNVKAPLFAARPESP